MLVRANGITTPLGFPAALGMADDWSQEYATNKTDAYPRSLQALDNQKITATIPSYRQSSICYRMGEMNSVTFAKAMADDTRQKIMRLLCCQWLCVSDVVEKLGGVSQPTVSHHLSILRQAGLVHTRREGKQVFYSLNQDEVAVCCGMLMQNFAPEKLGVGE